MFKYALGLLLFIGTGILLLNWMWKVAIKYKAIRIENDRLQSEQEKLTRDTKDYPRRVERLESQKQVLERQLKTEEGAADELRAQIKTVSADIAALESDRKELSLRLGLPRHSIELTNQEVAAGEIHLFIKVPTPPKEALRYLAQEEFRIVKHHDYKSDSVEDLAKWLKEGKIQWAFSKSPPGDIKRIEREDVPSDHEIFFIGDIHGDYKSLLRIVEHADTVDPQAILVFMGDLFDRGTQEMEAVLFFLTLVKYRPGRMLWIAGNHDAALNYDNNGFVSTVSPASFCETLNAHPEWKEFGQELIRLIETLPVAALFPDGLWVSHGAVPHSDVQNEIADLAALPKQAKTDCVSARLVDQPMKTPNRPITTHDVGYDNVIGFTKIIQEKTGVEIRHLLCAHQHKVTDGAGIAQYRKYFKSVLCHGLYSSSVSSSGVGTVAPCIAEHRLDRAPLIVVFDPRME